MRRGAIALAAAAAGMLLAGCGGGGADGLAGTSWTLVSLGPEGFPEPAIFGSKVTVEFSGSGDAIDGSGGCNSYSGEYATAGDVFKIRELMFTERACLEPEGVLEQEARYFEILASSRSHSVDGPRLTLRAPEDRVLIFRREGG